MRLSLHLVLGLICRLLYSRGVHSVTHTVRPLSLNCDMCATDPCIPCLIMSTMSLTPVWCRIQVLRLWLLWEMPNMMRSVWHWATASSSMRVYTHWLHHTLPGYIIFECICLVWPQNIAASNTKTQRRWPVCENNWVG